MATESLNGFYGGSTAPIYIEDLIRAAEDAATRSENAANSFDQKYLGGKTTPPTTDNSGNTLIVGATYWDIDDKTLYYWDGNDWVTDAVGTVKDAVGLFISTNTFNYPVGHHIHFKEFFLNSGKGAGDWYKDGTTGTPSSYPSGVLPCKFYDAAGYGWSLVGDVVNYWQVGAVEGGDSQMAIQSAWNSGKIVAGLTGDFRFDSALYMPNGLKFLGTHACAHKKNFLGNGIVNTAFPNYGSDITLENFYLTHESNSTNNRGYMWQLFVDNLTLINPKVRNIAAYSAVGCWSFYHSGKGGYISNPDIDARDAGLFGDGMHFAYLEDFAMVGGKVFGGDDGIALFVPSIQGAQPGRDLPSKNVSIVGTKVSSKEANIIRLGCAGAAIELGDAPANCVWQNVHIDISCDNLDGESIGRNISITDPRTPANIVGTHKDIFIRVGNIPLVGNGGGINVVGNADITNAANATVRNFENVTIEGSKHYMDNNTTWLRAGGIEKLTLKGFDVERDFVASFQILDINGVGELVFDGVDLQSGLSGTTGTSCSIRNTEKVRFKNGCDWVGGGEFAFINYITNATLDSEIYIDASCALHGAQRLLSNTNGATVSYAMQRISGDLYDASAATITADAQNRAAGYIRLQDGTVL
ncbi:putative tailspike protein [Vibrio phage Phriendly]|nr:putative tailspike protein [Vibrio phage Phriendly]